mgnify:CR=1 FL=1
MGRLDADLEAEFDRDLADTDVHRLTIDVDGDVVGRATAEALTKAVRS